MNSNTAMDVSAISINECVNLLSTNIAKVSAGSQNFAQSLIKQAGKRPLSEKQVYWVRRILTETLNPKKVETVKVGRMDKLVGMFSFAKDRLKFPKITIHTSETTSVRLSILGDRSKNKGDIAVKFNKPNAEGALVNLYAGRITQDGDFVPSLALENDDRSHVAALLMTVASNPKDALDMYGKKSGHCCFCNKTLTAEGSVDRGYGPVCASKYFPNA